MPRSKPKWIKTWEPFCPFDDHGLRIRGGSSGFFFYCGCCKREWPMTKADEAKIHDHRTSKRVKRA